MITIDEFLKDIYSNYEKYLENRSDYDYEIDEVQLNKLLGVYEFLKTVAKDCGGNVENADLIPREVHGGVTATYKVFYLSGDDITTFCNVIKEASALTLDVQGGEICISITIPSIFIPKK